MELDVCRFLGRTLVWGQIYKGSEYICLDEVSQFAESLALCDPFHPLFPILVEEWLVGEGSDHRNPAEFSEQLET